LLYSNLWIATAAVCMAIQTQFILTHSLKLEAYHGLLFFGTLFLYAAHRLIGLRRILNIHQEGRFAVIRELQTLVIILAIISAVFTTYFLYQMPRDIILWLLPAGLASAAYVFPVLKNNRRLRDINHIKIFLIALVWAWITGFIPAFLIIHESFKISLLIGLEHFFFIFAITLPFDIRDMKIDAAAQVKTLPATIGIFATKKLAYLCLFFMILFASWIFLLDKYSLSILCALTLCCLVCLVLIYHSKPDRPDYYYTGFLDGTMILQFLLVLGSQWV
jgi:4-hydroxybenzoate polyprenyltransferase